MRNPHHDWPCKLCERSVSSLEHDYIPGPELMYTVCSDCQPLFRELVSHLGDGAKLEWYRTMAKNRIARRGAVTRSWHQHWFSGDPINLLDGP